MMSGTILHGMILTGMTILMSDDLSASCSNAGMMIPDKKANPTTHPLHTHPPFYPKNQPSLPPLPRE